MYVYFFSTTFFQNIFRPDKYSANYAQDGAQQRMCPVLLFDFEQNRIPPSKL
jgi:hypothetical protein